MCSLHRINKKTRYTVFSILVIGFPTTHFFGFKGRLQPFSEMEKFELLPVEIEKPFFVFHPGPGKSGTTTIQSDLQREEVQAFFVRQNYTYLPHHLVHLPRRDFFVSTKKKFPQENASRSELDFNPGFKKVIKAQKKKLLRKNMIGSSEYLSRPSPLECRLWRKTFMDDQAPWDMQVVIVYRRIHSALPSVYNQRFKFARSDDGHPVRMGHWDWPGINGEIRVPGFVEWLHGWLAYNYLEAEAQVSYNAWQNCSNEITVVSMHNVDAFSASIVSNLTATVLCSTTAGKSICNGLRSQKKQAQSQGNDGLVLNPSVPLEHEILAVYAYENGFLASPPNGTNTSLRRHQVVEAIGQHVALNAISYPMKCPDYETLELFYNISLKGEEWYLTLQECQDNYCAADPMFDMSAFDADWEEHLNGNKLCEIDVHAVMKDEKWQSFFSSLQASNT